MKAIFSPKFLKETYPISLESQRFISESRFAANQILDKRDERIAIITGPCSIHDVNSALEYGKQLKALSDELSDSLLLVMRVFIEKPRTLMGWKGYVNDPFLDGSHDIEEGLMKSRELFLTLTEMRVPIAMEFLDPFIAPYFSDLVTWGFIGARTSASQVHRQLASSLPMPVGFKNGTDGNLRVAAQGAQTAREPHTFLALGETGTPRLTQSEGNPYTHVVLRGSEEATNYEEASIIAAQKLLLPLKTPLLIDCAHGNCQKEPLLQKEVFYATLDHLKRGHNIAGMMLESHLTSGKQSFSPQPDGDQSITDPCLDWDETQRLLEHAHQQMLVETLATRSL